MEQAVMIFVVTLIIFVMGGMIVTMLLRYTRKNKGFDVDAEMGNKNE